MLVARKVGGFLSHGGELLGFRTQPGRVLWKGDLLSGRGPVPAAPEPAGNDRNQNLIAAGFVPGEDVGISRLRSSLHDAQEGLGIAGGFPEGHSAGVAD